MSDGPFIAEALENSLQEMCVERGLKIRCEEGKGHSTIKRLPPAGTDER